MKPLLIVTALLLCHSIHAHSLNIFANYDGNLLKGRAYSGASGIVDATVIFINVDGKELGRTLTDESGNFSFIPVTRCALKCTLELSDGHSASYFVESSFSESKNTNEAHETDPQELKHQVSSLQNQLAHQHKTRLRDIMGGLGFILGLAGIFMFIKSKKTA